MMMMYVRNLIASCLLLAPAALYAQDTASLNARWRQELKNLALTQDLQMLDSIVRVGAPPEAIEALKHAGHLSAVTYVGAAWQSKDKYQYDSLRLTLVADAGSVLTALENSRKINALARLKDQYKLIVTYKGWAPGLDDPQIAELQDGEYYLARINKVFNTRKDVLTAKGWSRDKYIAWEGSMHPADGYQRAVLRKSFLKYIKLSYGLEP